MHLHFVKVLMFDNYFYRAQIEKIEETLEKVLTKALDNTQAAKVGEFNQLFAL